MEIRELRDKARMTHTIAGEAQLDKSSEKVTESVFWSSLSDSKEFNEMIWFGEEEEKRSS
jgi:hypothetical protein